MPTATSLFMKEPQLSLTESTTIFPVQGFAQNETSITPIFYQPESQPSVTKLGPLLPSHSECSIIFTVSNGKCVNVWTDCQCCIVLYLIKNTK